MNIWFRTFKNDKPLDRFNKKLAKRSDNRLELRISKRAIPYLIDNGDVGYYRVVRSTEEINEIMKELGLTKAYKDVIEEVI